MDRYISTLAGSKEKLQVLHEKYKRSGPQKLAATLRQTQHSHGLAALDSVSANELHRDGRL